MKIAIDINLIAHGFNAGIQIERGLTVKRLTYHSYTNRTSKTYILLVLTCPRSFHTYKR